MAKQTTHGLRYQRTMAFIQKSIPEKCKILDLGSENAFSELLRKEGFSVVNTGFTDLDLQPEIVTDLKADVATALEILEHLVSPMQVLKNLPANKLIASIPMRLWFAPAYRSNSDPWDRHFHEFEDWQFDWLLEKAGWKIVSSEKWISPSSKIGFRPFLRKITPRYYIVYAERI
ncbi:MAG: hypothetical protein WC384_08650 [Prolixibacteraceae bacterium]|jgi:hypothetical protein